MKFLFVSIFLVLVSYCKAGDEQLYSNLANAICSCLDKNEISPDSILENTAYSTCIIEQTKSFKKPLKKLVKKMMKASTKEGENMGEGLEEFNRQLDAALKKSCPEQSSIIRDVVQKLMNGQ